MSPPIRKHDVDGVALQDAIRARVLDVVATDHAVFNTKQKAVGKKDFRILPNGVNGLEERIPVLWAQMVETGKLSARDFVRVTSSDVARIFNVYPRKGAIAVGSDADLYILDPKQRTKVSAKTHHSNLDINVFEGFETPKVATTISRGKVAWDGSKLLTKDGDGQRVDTPPYPPILFEGLDKEEKLMGQRAWPTAGKAVGRSEL